MAEMRLECRLQAQLLSNSATLLRSLDGVRILDEREGLGDGSTNSFDLRNRFR